MGERFERLAELSVTMCVALKDLYYVEWFVQFWIIRTSFNDLYYVEWFVLRWMIFENLCDAKWFVQLWKNCTTLNGSECDGWFVQRSIMWTRMFIEYRPINECQVWLFEKFNIFYTNLWIDISLIWKYQEKIDSAMPKKLVIKRCFWSL